MSIDKFVRLLQPRVLSGVGSVKRMSHDRVVERLSELEFVTRNVNVNQASGQVESLELQILDEELLYHLLSGEANRFFLAAALSYARSQQVQDENAAWQIVEHYYCAYYSVHYLLRMTGHSLTSLDSSATTAIKNSYFGSNTLPSIPEGLYELSFGKSTQILTLKKMSKGGGSHMDAWKMWAVIIDQMLGEANSDPTEYTSEFVTLAAHKQFVIRATGKYRPPEIRGQINYQFRGGAWRFEKNAKQNITMLQRGIADISALPISTADPVAMLRNNYFIYSLALAFFRAAAENYPRSITRSIQNKYSDVIC